CVNFIPPAKDDFMSLAVAEEYPPGKYQSVPRWNMLIFALFLAYALCDLDKVNLSVAILPISKLFGLTEADVGIALHAHSTARCHPHAEIAGWPCHSFVYRCAGSVSGHDWNSFSSVCA
ncbi:unnamed protein product, partial [Polarella glacialis]